MDDAAAMIPDPVRGGISTIGTERNWPLNCWWVAAHASEVGQTPILRWISEMPLAIYRTDKGMVVALHDRCPHRWAPLHLGEVKGVALECPYHGMRFAPSGQCVAVPTQESVPATIKVRSFPVVELYGFVWIWTGDAARADPYHVPSDLAYLSHPDWHVVWGYRSVNANFMQLKENVLDPTHFNFLHKNSIGVEGWDSVPAVEVVDGRVRFRKLFDMQPLAPVYALPAGKPIGKLVNRDNWGVQLSAGAHHGSVDMHDPDPEPNGLDRFSMRVVHLTTPVSTGKSHYYWAIARDHGAPFDYDQTRAASNIVFDEDIGIVEATQEMARRSIDHDGAVEFSVAADKAAVQGRRLIRMQVDDENCASNGAGRDNDEQSA